MSDIPTGLEAPQRTAQDLLGLPEQFQKQQTAQDILGPQQYYEAERLHGSYWDNFFSTDEGPGKMMDLFNQGYKKAWGTEPLGFSKESEKSLREYGIFSDIEKHNSNIIRQFNEGLLRGTAALADYAMRSIYSTARGLAETAGAPGLTSKALAPIGGAASAGFEAFPAGEATGFPAAHGDPLHPTTIDAALDLGLGRDKPTLPDMAPEGRPTATEQVLPERTPDVVAEAATGDANARAVAMRPEAFDKLTQLQEQRQVLHDWLRETIEGPPTSFRIGGVEVPAETAIGELPAATARAEEAPQGQQAARASIAESLRRDIARIDEQIDGLMPDIREAYKEVSPPISYEFTPVQYADVGLPTEGPVEPVAPPRTQAEIANLSQRRTTIAQDVFRDLREAGRPADEARGAAALIQAHYEARAARFEGRLGSARDLYDAEAPSVRSGQGGNRGALSLSDNAITLFKNADASTFLHETAHNWFEEMLRDAGRAEAPIDLKADVDAVKAWLQMIGDRPTRAQHERFARGFERYVMEGVAPTPKLASVFAKFRDWLVKLYQTVSRLKAPITDDIRAVYDRLLHAPANEASIAPERPVRQNFADVHEADLRTATDENFLARAENVRAERDTIASQLRAEIDAGRRRARAATRTSARAVEGDTGGTEVPARPAEPVSTESSGANTSTEPSEVSPSGATFKAEAEQVTDPNQRLSDRPDTKLVDRAGNIRLENLSAPPEVEDAIRLSAQYNRGFGYERRGVVTDGQILELAQQLGMDPAFLDKKAIGEAFNAEEILAARLLLRQSEAEIRAAMKTVNEGGDPLELAKAVARNEMIQGKVAQATAEWGRAGRAFHELNKFTKGDALAQFLKDNKGDFGRTYDQLLQMARYGEDMLSQGQLNNFVRGTHGAKGPILFYYLNSLLSGPITHSVYVMGNMLRAVADPGYALTSAAVRQVMESMGREAKGEQVTAREAYASLMGILQGSVDGWSAAKTAFKSGVQVALPGQRGFTGPFNNYVVPATSTVGRIYGLPYRSVAAIHSFGATMRYMQNLNRYAVRTALAEGLTGDALEARIAKLKANPPDEFMETAFNANGHIMPDIPAEWVPQAEIMKRAGEEAMTQMYMRTYDYDSWQAQFIRGIHSVPGGAVMVPFAKVGLEIQRETFLRHSPLGLLLDKEVKGDVFRGEKGQAGFDEAIARQMIGLSLFGMGVGFTAGGIMTGYGPFEKEQRQIWLLTHTPYSMQIGNLVLPMQGFPVIGKLMQFGADMYETQHYWDGKELSKVAKGYFQAFARAAFDEGLFRDVSELGDAMNHPEENAARFILNWIPNWLPWGVGLGQVNKFMVDPYSKDIHGFDLENVINAIRSRVPGASWGVPNRIDLFGNPVLARGSVEGHYNQYINDPVAQALQGLHVGISKPERKVLEQDLTTRQYEHYSIMAGKLTYEFLQGLVLNPTFKQQPEGTQRIQIHDTIEKARNMARAQIATQSMQENPRDNLVTGYIKKKQELLK